MPVVVAELAGSSSYGGGERYLELLLDRMDRTRFHPLLICPEPGSFIGRMEARGVETHLVHLAPLFNPIALWRLIRLLVQKRVTILQTHGARANVYGRIAGWLAGVPVVISTVHNSLKDYEVSPFKRWAYVMVLRLTLPLVQRIICVSDATRRDVIDECPAVGRKALTVHNGVDPSSFRLQPDRQKNRLELGIPQGPVLVTIGRLTEQKGHQYLLAALSGLLDTWPELCCLFVGEGEQHETLQRLAQDLGVERACRFVGVREDIADILAAATLCVLPSLSEGFPFVLLEALAMGCPVVATSVNGVPELIDGHRTGLLVPPRDPQALAVAIRSLLSDPLAASRMASAGQALVRERFTVDRMVANTTAVFDAAIQEAGVRTPDRGKVPA